MAKERSEDYVVVIEAYLHATNPIDLRELGSRVEFTASEIKSELKRLGVTKDFKIKSDGEYSGAWWQWFNRDSVREAIVASGYDGVVMREEASGCSKFNDENDIWVVFDPNQIKSKENDGTWDADDADIRSNPELTYKESISNIQIPIGATRRLSNGKTQVLSLVSVRSIPFTKGNKIYAQKVKEYMDDLESGTPICEPDIRIYDGKQYIEDGHHRIEAAKQLKIKKIPMWIQEE